MSADPEIRAGVKSARIFRKYQAIKLQSKGAFRAAFFVLAKATAAKSEQARPSRSASGKHFARFLAVPMAIIWLVKWPNAAGSRGTFEPPM